VLFQVETDTEPTITAVTLMSALPSIVVAPPPGSGPAEGVIE